MDWRSRIGRLQLQGDVAAGTPAHGRTCAAGMAGLRVWFTQGKSGGKRHASAFLLAALLWTGAWSAGPLHGQSQAQAAGAPAGQDALGPALPPTAALLQPAVDELRTAVTELRISKWKAPGPVKQDAEQNLGSITRDIDTTLPGLITQADGAPHSIASYFAVYRNLDALYEVLLRVSSTADLAASDPEASSLSHALTTLENTRRSLGDAILSTSQAQLSLLEQPRVPAAAAAPAPPPPATSVVSDGLAAPAAHKKAKPKPKAAAATPQT